MSATDGLARGGPYRARDGLVLGVCEGIARHLNVSVFWLRVVAIVLMLATGFWPVVLVYFGAALLMKTEPVLPVRSEDEAEFYHTLATSRRMALHRLRAGLDRVERRIRRLEDAVTARDYDWERRLDE
jgi:phage shock protein C